MCRASFLDVELLAVDGSDSAPPAAECLLEVQIDSVDEIVAFTGIQGVRFLMIKC